MFWPVYAVAPRRFGAGRLLARSRTSGKFEGEGVPERRIEWDSPVNEVVPPLPGTEVQIPLASAHRRTIEHNGPRSSNDRSI